MKRAVFPLLILVALLFASLSVRAESEESETYQDDYQEGDFGRVRQLEGGATVLRGASGASAGLEEDASLNSPLFPGDTLRTDPDQRAEIELALGSLLRLDRGTELTLQALPDPASKHSDNTVLKLALGTLQVSARGGDDGELRIDTPACSVYPQGDGDYRIDVDDEGRTHVASRRGVAEVVGDEGSVLVRAGMRSVVDPRSVPDDPRSFNTFAEDGFDHWVAELENAGRESRASSGADAYDEIPHEVRPYYRELTGYGSWVYLPTYGYAWHPYERSPGWRPYLDGSWYYGSRGYFWVSSEPWGWAPYHYGRWTFASGHGWCWIPGRVFAGAWVSWSWGPSVVGWCPLDFWNRPAFYQTRYYGVYDPGCWTFVNYAHLTARGYRRHAVPVERIGAVLRTSAVVTRAPRVAPSALARDPATRQRALRGALEDRRTRILPAVGRQTTPVRNFTEVEKDVRRGTPRSAPPVSIDRRSRGTSAQPERARPLKRSPRNPTIAPRQGTDPSPRRSLPVDRRPRVLNRGDVRGTVPDPEARRNVRRGPDSPRAPEPRSVQQPGQDPAGRAAPADRLRDMYRRMASPRVPRERGQELREQRRGTAERPPVRMRRPEPAQRAVPAPPPAVQKQVSAPPPRPRPRAAEQRGGNANHGRERKRK